MTVAVRIRFGHLDYMPRCVTTRRIAEFCGHCANDTLSNQPEAFRLPTPSGAPFPGSDAIPHRAGVTVGAADAGEGKGTSHDASISRGGQDNHA